MSVKGAVLLDMIPRLHATDIPRMCGRHSQGGGCRDAGVFLCLHLWEYLHHVTLMVLDFWLTDENSGLGHVWGLPLYIKLNFRLETESLTESPHQSLQLLSSQETR